MTLLPPRESWIVFKYWSLCRMLGSNPGPVCFTLLQPSDMFPAQSNMLSARLPDVQGPWPFRRHDERFVCLTVFFVAYTPFITPTPACRCNATLLYLLFLRFSVSYTPSGPPNTYPTVLFHDCLRSLALLVTSRHIMVWFLLSPAVIPLDHSFSFFPLSSIFFPKSLPWLSRFLSFSRASLSPREPVIYIK